VQAAWEINMGDDVMGDNAETLWTALLAVQGEAIQILRDTEGQVGSRVYKYVTLEQINEKVLPRLTHYGLLWVTRLVDRPDGPTLRYTMLHVPTGEADDGEIRLPLPGGYGAQDFGSAATYMRRYSLMAYLNLAPSVAEDDDGGQAQAAAEAHATVADKPLSERNRTAALSALAKMFDSDEQEDLFLGAVGVSTDRDSWTHADGLAIQRALRARAKP
jgi:hypothetical protein